MSSFFEVLFLFITSLAKYTMLLDFNDLYLHLIYLKLEAFAFALEDITENYLGLL